ncbi:flavoprotein [Rhizobium leguminosarum]|uniref:flavoprotein n=1 Tax=Rhizobium leguminosarum TaxID=384 RepID=UPI003F9BC141
MLDRLNICCTGSISIISIPQLILTIRLAYRTRVSVFLSKGAEKLITAQTFRALTDCHVYTEVSEANRNISKWRDSPTLIAPATASAIGAMAAGLTSHVAAAIAMDCRSKTLVAPAMHKNMWDNPSTQRSVVSIIAGGCILIGPEPGREVSDLSMSPSSLASVDTIIKSLLIHLT